MRYLYSWIFSSSIYYYRASCSHTPSRRSPSHVCAFKMSCKRSKPLLTSRFLLVSSYLETRRTRSPYLLYVLYILQNMVGGVANYYATKNVVGLEVNGVLLFLSLNVFQPPSCQNRKQKNVPRINESNYFENTHSGMYMYSTSSLLTLQSQWVG